MTNKFSQVEEQINSVMVDREEEVRICILAWLTRNNTLLVGPPGTGKTMLANLLAQSVQGKVFSTLFHDGTKAEEITGPYSYRKLVPVEEGKDSEYEHVTEDTLVDADFAVLDEIFSATAVNRSTNSILNERRFKNGRSWIEVPLQTCIACTNHFPDPDEKLDAVFDRFLLRKRVRPIGSLEGRNALVLGDMNAAKVSVRISRTEVEQAKQDVGGVNIPEESHKMFIEILDALEAEGIMPSDRRIRKSSDVARAAAYLDGRNEVQPVDMLYFKHILWVDPETQIDKTEEIVTDIIDPRMRQIQKLLEEASEIAKSVSTLEPTNIKDGLEYIENLSNIHRKLNKIDGSKDAVDKVKSLESDVREYLLSEKNIDEAVSGS